MTSPLKKSFTRRSLDFKFQLWRTHFFTYGSVDDHSEVVHQTFPVEEVVGGEQEVPGEGTEPRQSVYPVDGVTDVDDFFEAFHLDYKCLDHKKQ